MRRFRFKAEYQTRERSVQKKPRHNQEDNAKKNSGWNLRRRHQSDFKAPFLSFIIFCVGIIVTAVAEAVIMEAFCVRSCERDAGD